MSARMTKKSLWAIFAIQLLFFKKRENILLKLKSPELIPSPQLKFCYFKETYF